VTAVAAEGVGIASKLHGTRITKAGSVGRSSVLEAAIWEDDTAGQSGCVTDLQVTTQVQRAQRHGCAYTQSNVGIIKGEQSVGCEQVTFVELHGTIAATWRSIESCSSLEGSIWEYDATGGSSVAYVYVAPDICWIADGTSAHTYGCEIALIDRDVAWQTVGVKELQLAVHRGDAGTALAESHIARDAAQCKVKCWIIWQRHPVPSSQILANTAGSI